MSGAGIVIIGAGHAAVRAVLSLRDAGFDGKITMIAEEGVGAPYERPPLSKWKPDQNLEKPLVTEDQLDSVERIAAKVTSLDREAHKVTLNDGAVLEYDRLLLATGASARRLDHEATIYYLRDLPDADALKHDAETANSATIIGGGFIGLELAASLRGMGLSVHVLEAADRLLARGVTAPVARIVQTLHEAHGVTFGFNTTITSIDGSGCIKFENGGSHTSDLIIAGVGSVPNTKLAEDAGLTVANGISVDTHLRTSDPDIFAAGDCCAFPLYGSEGSMTRLESWQAAGEQGALAGRNMVRPTMENCTLVPWFWSEQYDHVLQVSGLRNANLQFTERYYTDDHHVSFGTNAQGRLAFACGIAPGTKVAKDIRFAAKLIEAGTPVETSQLGDPSVTLKSLR